MKQIREKKKEETINTFSLSRKLSYKISKYSLWRHGYRARYETRWERGDAISCGPQCVSFRCIAFDAQDRRPSRTIIYTRHSSRQIYNTCCRTNIEPKSFFKAAKGFTIVDSLAPFLAEHDRLCLRVIDNACVRFIITWCRVHRLVCRSRVLLENRAWQQIVTR